MNIFNFNKLNTIELILILLINLVLIGFLILSFNPSNPIYYISLLFFISPIYFILSKMFKSKKQLTKHQQFENNYSVDGIIQYSKNGFMIDTELRGKLNFLWSEIIKITITKNSLLSSDELTMLVYSKNDKFVLHESMSGFYQFSLKIYTFLNGVDRNWQKNIYSDNIKNSTIIIFEK